MTLNTSVIPHCDF